MDQLTPFDTSNIERVLCVVAHPDDMEYGTSAAVAELTSHGIEVSYLLLTAGEAGIRSMHPDETRVVRAAEQRQACDIVGVHSLKILDFADGLLEHSLETRAAIAREIRRVRPHVIFTMDWALEAEWGLNHVDHRAAGLAVIDAIRDADNPWIFSDQLTQDGLAPWSTPWLLVSSHDPDHVIEVSETSFERGVASLEAHKRYLEDLLDHPLPRDLIGEILSAGGASAGVRYGLPVRAHRM